MKWACGWAAKALDCKSSGVSPSQVQVLPRPQVADVAQVAEHILGKNEVRSANLRIGSRKLSI